MQNQGANSLNGIFTCEIHSLSEKAKVIPALLLGVAAIYVSYCVVINDSSRKGMDWVIAAALLGFGVFCCYKSIVIFLKKQGIYLDGIKFDNDKLDCVSIEADVESFNTLRCEDRSRLLNIKLKSKRQFPLEKIYLAVGLRQSKRSPNQYYLERVAIQDVATNAQEASVTNATFLNDSSENNLCVLSNGDLIMFRDSTELYNKNLAAQLALFAQTLSVSIPLVPRFCRLTVRAKAALRMTEGGQVSQAGLIGALINTGVEKYRQHSLDERIRSTRLIIDENYHQKLNEIVNKYNWDLCI